MKDVRDRHWVKSLVKTRRLVEIVIDGEGCWGFPSLSFLQSF